MPELADAEIIARLPHFQKKSSFLQHFLQYEGPEMDNPQKTLDQIGGSIRIAETIMHASETEIPSAIANFLHKNTEGKVQFGFSCFGHKDQKKWLLDTKKNLQKMGRNARIVNRNFQNLDAGTLHREKKKTVEFLILKTGHRDFLVAKTVAAQNVAAFSHRDFDKPVRDMRVGLLPPKLALALINFARVDGNIAGKLWDPFCGMGTLLIEAKNENLPSTGSDISKEMVEASRKNGAFFFGKDAPKVFSHDATTSLPENINREEVITVVSEGYLGPIFNAPLTEKSLVHAKHAVEPLILSFLKKISASTNIRRVVICLPFWRMYSGKNAHCEKILAFTEKFWKNRSVSHLHFRRENQIVGRQIVQIDIPR